MAKKNSKVSRNDPNFMKEIEDMRIQRILRGKDNVLKPTSPRRITLAMTRWKDFKKMKKDIIEADLP